MDKKSIPSQHRDTVEVYKELVHIEVRALVTRVADLTNTISAVFTEVTALALQLEESSGKLEQLDTSLAYCRDEIKKLKELVKKQQDKP